MAGFIMSGRYQAIVFISLFAVLSLVIPPFVFLSNAAVALVALRQGYNQGIIVALISSIVFAVIAMLLQQNFLTGLASALQQWLPMILFATILTRTVSWAYTLQAMLLIVVGGLIVFHLSISDAQEYWKDTISHLVDVFSKEQAWSKEDSRKFIEVLSTWVSTIIAVGLLVSWIVSMFIARHWQAMLYNPGGFGEEFRELRLGKVLAIALLIVVLLFVMTDSQLFADLSIVGMTVYFFQGLALIHGLVKKLQMSHFWLVGMYIFMIPIFPSMLVIIILLVSFGIIDSFADFRNTLTINSN